MSEQEPHQAYRRQLLDGKEGSVNISAGIFSSTTSVPGEESASMDPLGGPRIPGEFALRTWFVRGEQGDADDILCSVLRQWAGRPENKCWSVDCLCGTVELTTALQARQPDILVLAEPSCPAGPWTAETLAHGVGLVVATSLQAADSYRVLAEKHPIQLTPLPPTVEAVGLAILNVLACLRRQRDWQAHIAQLQQRLTDRIVIERAKGVLVERLNISEKEAYTRLRVLSRRQRQPIRDIAQSLLNAQPLLLPEINNFVYPPRRGRVPTSDTAL